MKLASARRHGAHSIRAAGSTPRIVQGRSLTDASRGLGLELHFDFPGVAKELLLTVGGELAADLAAVELEIAHLHRADRREATLFVRLVDDFTADDAAVLLDRDDERAAELAERRPDLRLVGLRMVLLGHDQNDRRLVHVRLTLCGGDIGKL